MPVLPNILAHYISKHSGLFYMPLQFQNLPKTAMNTILVKYIVHLTSYENISAFKQQQGPINVSTPNM